LHSVPDGGATEQAVECREIRIGGEAVHCGDVPPQISFHTIARIRSRWLQRLARR
jgi:hypothetical protein